MCDVRARDLAPRPGSRGCKKFFTGACARATPTHARAAAGFSSSRRAGAHGTRGPHAVWWVPKLIAHEELGLCWGGAELPGHDGHEHSCR